MLVSLPERTCSSEPAVLHTANRIIAIYRQDLQIAGRSTEVVDQAKESYILAASNDPGLAKVQTLHKIASSDIMIAPMYSRANAAYKRELQFNLLKSNLIEILSPEDSLGA